MDRRKYIVYSVKGNQREPIAILIGAYRVSTESFPVTSAAKLEVREINRKLKSVTNKQVAKNVQYNNDMRRELRAVLNEPNQTKVITGRNTILPFVGESGHSFYLKQRSSIRVKGKFRKISDEYIESKCGLHTVFVEGNARLFIVPPLVSLLVLKGSAIFDYPCGEEYSEAEEFNKMELLSTESNVCAVDRQYTQIEKWFLSESLLVEYLKDSDEMIGLGHIVGFVYRQGVDRKPDHPPSNSQIESKFLVANLHDPQLSDLATQVTSSRQTLLLVGSEKSMIVLYGNSGSGIQLAGYWSVQILTGQLKVIKEKEKIKPISITDTDRLVVRLAEGLVHLFADPNHTTMFASSEINLDIE